MESHLSIESAASEFLDLDCGVEILPCSTAFCLFCDASNLYLPKGLLFSFPSSMDFSASFKGNNGVDELYNYWRSELTCDVHGNTCLLEITCPSPGRLSSP
jgi:hypothetical protein